MAYRKSAREEPAPARPAARDTFVASAPGEPFALRRRQRRLSTFERRLLGGALSVPCVLFASSPLLGLDFHSNGPIALMLAAVLIWFFPVERLFLPTERLTGLVPVRRSVRIRPMPGRAPAGDDVLVDDQPIAVAGRVSVCVLDLSFYVKGGLRSDHVVCLLAARWLYEVDTFPDERSTDAFVEVLSLALRRAPERARRTAGPADWEESGTGMAAGASAGLGLAGTATLLAIAQRHSVAPSQTALAAIGVAVLVARASAVFRSLARFEARRETFHPSHFGASPACPPGWVTAPLARALFRVAYAALALVVVASIALALQR